MLESVAKVMWILLTGAFAFGAWSATLEYRVQNHDARIGVIEDEYKADQKEIIKFMSRVDEQLKSLKQGRGR